jgi:CO/xanthine dehydrogenase FAD-binding subunit
LKPAKFEYHAPKTLDEALILAAQYGDDARIVAGGQSLVPMMNLRLAQPDHVIDINNIAELSYIRPDSGSVEIGALTRHHQIEHSSELMQLCPPLPAAARNIGHYALRERGTIGGSLALADPAAEFPLMAILLEAEVVARSSNGERGVMARDFFVSVFTTSLEPGEIITGVRCRALAQGEGWGFRWLARRSGDYAMVNAATTLTLDGAGKISRIAMALGGVGATPIRLTALEQSARGREPTGDWAGETAAEAAAQVEPESDKHASTEFRKELIEVLLGRALGDALARAKGRAVA